MDASQIIDELCARYGVSKEFGRRIQPLVVRASQVRPELKDRILQMVEVVAPHRGGEQRILPEAEIPFPGEEEFKMSFNFEAYFGWILSSSKRYLIKGFTKVLSSIL